MKENVVCVNVHGCVNVRGCVEHNRVQRERESLNCVHVICRKISFDNEISANEFQG